MDKSNAPMGASGVSAARAQPYDLDVTQPIESPERINEYESHTTAP
jgi:hypothetical protein